MRNRSYWTTSKQWQMNLASKKLPHAHDTNGQQIPEASADVTSLVFPAIGAILILLFGGFLLSSGNSCCHVDASNKKKNGDESEGIDFPYMDNITYPKPFPVLQQENNDVVEAVLETYSDLPQYAPINELMTSIPGISRHAQQAETRDACVSPIHCLDSSGTLNRNQDGHVMESNHVGNHDDANGYHGDDDDGDDELNEQTELDCTIHEENNDKAYGQSSLNVSSGIGSCSSVNTPALSIDSGLAPENMRSLYIPIQLQKHKRAHSRTNASALSIDSGRMSEDRRKTPISDHLLEIKKSLNASFGLEAVNGHKPLEVDDGADGNDLGLKQGLSIERWVKETSHPTYKTSPYQWKRPMKLSKQNRLDILKRLQPNLDAATANTISTVTTSSSTREETTHDDRVEQRNIGGYIVNTYGGRLSCLKVVRAPSSMCIHGNICRFNCKANHVTDKMDGREDDSGRGASYLGMTPTATARCVDEFTEKTIGARDKVCLDDISRGARKNCNESMRGASAFDGRGCTLIEDESHARGARGNDMHMRGASAFAENDSSLFIKHRQKESESDTHIRGASAFAESDPLQYTNATRQRYKNSELKPSNNHAISKNDKCHDDPSSHIKPMQYQETTVPKAQLDNSQPFNNNNKMRCSSYHKERPTSKCNERDISRECRGASGFGQSYADCLSMTGTASVTLSMAVQSEREDITLASIAPNPHTNRTGLMEEQQTRELHHGGRQIAGQEAVRFQANKTELEEEQKARKLRNDGRQIGEGQETGVTFQEGRDKSGLIEEQHELELHSDGHHTMEHNDRQLLTGEHNETTMSVNHRIFNVNSVSNFESTKHSNCRTSYEVLTPLESEMKSLCNSNTARVKGPGLWVLEQANDAHFGSRATHGTTEISSKSHTNDKQPNQPQTEGVKNHAAESIVEIAMETTKEIQPRPRGMVAMGNKARHAIGEAENSSYTTTLSKKDDYVAKDYNSRDTVAKDMVCNAVAIGNISNDTDKVTNSYKLRDVSGKLRDIIVDGQRSIDFNPSRSSTPNCNDVMLSKHNITMATKREQEVASHDEGIDNKGVERTVSNTSAPKMSLGKNPQALSGLLKALQREKRKKDCVTEKDCVTSKHSANGNADLVQSDYFESNNKMRVKASVTHDSDCVTDSNCVTASNGVTAKPCVTAKYRAIGNNSVANIHCVEGDDCVTNKDCVTDSNIRTSKSIPAESTNQNTRSSSPEGSDVTHSGRRRQVVGKLKVCLFYSNNNADKPVLYLTVLKASSLRQALVQSDEDLYIQMHVSTRDGKVQQTKSVSVLSNTAVFNHLFQVHDITLRELQVSTIKLVLVSGHSKQEEAVASIPLAELIARDKIKKTYLLKRYSPQTSKVKKREPIVHVPVGSLYLGLKYNSVDEKLLVNITKARGLPSMTGWGQTDPYVILTVKDDGKILDEKITCTKWNQRNPQFDANFVLEVSRERIGTTSLLLRVMNNSANHSLIGAVKIGMDSPEDSGRQHWESILDQDSVHDERWHKLFK